jgi:hypothetical protein
MTVGEREKWIQKKVWGWYRKANTGYDGFYQVAQSLGGLNIPRDMTYDISPEAALFEAIAEKIVPLEWEGEWFVDHYYGGKFELILLYPTRYAL